MTPMLDVRLSGMAWVRPAGFALEVKQWLVRRLLVLAIILMMI